MRGNLILSRRVGEKIVIEDPYSGNPVNLTIMSIYKNQVKLSFDAPKNVSVDRKEIYDLKHP